MKHLIYSGRKIALTSFIIGTLLLVIFLVLNKNTNLLIPGLYYTVGAFIINSIACLVILLYAIINKTYRIKLLKTCALMLINIPITILYIFIIFG